MSFYECVQYCIRTSGTALGETIFSPNNACSNVYTAGRPVELWLLPMRHGVTGIFELCPNSRFSHASIAFVVLELLTEVL